MGGEQCQNCNTLLLNLITRYFDFESYHSILWHITILSLHTLTHNFDRKRSSRSWKGGKSKKSKVASGLTTLCVFLIMSKSKPRLLWRGASYWLQYACLSWFTVGGHWGGEGYLYVYWQWCCSIFKPHSAVLGSRPFVSLSIYFVQA